VCVCTDSRVSPSYIIVDGVAYLTIAERSYPRKLAFSYLDEVSKEFTRSFGGDTKAPRLCTVRIVTELLTWPLQRRQRDPDYDPMLL
jgi:hypothetical protein